MQKLTQPQQEIFKKLCQCKNFEPNPAFVAEKEKPETRSDETKSS